jgi:hypothetical protein
VGGAADHAREFAYAHLFGSALEAPRVALDLRIPVGELQPESDGFGVDAMRASDHGGVLKFVGAAIEHASQAL